MPRTGSPPQSPVGRFLRRHWVVVVAAAILLVAGAQLARQAWDDSLTYDEVDYIKDGVCSLHTGIIDQWESSNPPIFKLASGVAVSSQFSLHPTCYTSARYEPSTLGGLRRFIFVARVPAILVSLLLLAALGWWITAMVNATAGLAAMAIGAIEPTIIGHGHLATSDIWLTFAGVAFLALHWRNRQHPSFVTAILAGVAFGFALLSKVTGLALVPIVLVIDLVVSFTALRAGYKLERVRGLVRALKPYAVWYGIVAAVSFAVLWLPYLLMKPLPTMHRLDLGLPGTWMHGLRFQWMHSRKGLGASNYINGELRFNQRIPYYYVEALALKGSPLLLLGLAVGPLSARVRNRDVLLWLVFPSLVLIAIPSAGIIHIGVRYVLGALPLLAGVAAVGYESVWRSVFRRLTRKGLAAGVMVVTMSIVVAFSVSGEGISYFNPIASRHPEKYLSDSNLDWGQDAWRVRDWWKSHGRPNVIDDTFGRYPLSFYGITSDAEKPCAASVTIASAHFLLLDKTKHVKRKLASISPAVHAYAPDCDDAR